jgi:mercuric ion transport protein
MTQEGGALLLKLGIVGAILTCVACFTPAAVLLLGLLGLAGWAGYLDYVLFPLLGLFLILLGYSYWHRWHGKQAGAPGREVPGTSARP